MCPTFTCPHPHPPPPTHTPARTGKIQEVEFSLIERSELGRLQSYVAASKLKASAAGRTAPHHTHRTYLASDLNHTGCLKPLARAGGPPAC